MATGTRSNNDERRQDEVSLSMELHEMIEEVDAKLKEKDFSVLRDEHRQKVMEWMESHYPKFAGVIKTTETVDSFHLAVENEEEFPFDDIVKVTKEMVSQCLEASEECDGDTHIVDRLDKSQKLRADYLKSMFMCTTPEALAPLAAKMYQTFEDNYSDYMYEVEEMCGGKKKVLRKYYEKIKVMRNELDKELKRQLPKKLLLASRKAEDIERSFYFAYYDWREIPHSHAVAITDEMAKYLDEDEEEEYLSSLFFSLDNRRLLPLAITMFQKYREVCPDKPLDQMMTAADDKGKKSKYLVRVLLRRNILTEEQYKELFGNLVKESKQVSRLKKRVTDHGLKLVLDKFSEIDLHGFADYNHEQLPYDDADYIAKIILEHLQVSGDEELYVKTMSTITAKQSFWKHVGVIMCQQYTHRYSGNVQYCFSKYFEVKDSHIYVQCFLKVWKEMWQRNLLSEAAMYFYVRTTLRQHLLCKGPFPYTLFLNFLDSLPATVYTPVFVSTPVACDFSRTTWVQPVLPLKPASEDLFNRFVNILVTGAIEMEKPTDAPAYKVLLKAVTNKNLSGSMVEILLDEMLKQFRTITTPNMLHSEEVTLHIAAARRDPLFITVTCKIVENSDRDFIELLFDLAQDVESDDTTVSKIIDKILESPAHPIEKSTQAKRFMQICSEYSNGSRSVTATVIWKYCSQHLELNSVLSASVKEDVPLAILREFNIDLYSNACWDKDGNSPLYIAAIKGYTKFIKLALNRGFVNLLRYVNKENQLLVEVAINHEHYDTAAVILREMNDYKICIADPNGGTKSDARVNFRKLLGKLIVGKKSGWHQFQCCDEKASADVDKEEEKERRKTIRECLVAILDSTVDQDAGVIHHEVLEVDEKGNTPDRDEFKCPMNHSIELITKNPHKLKTLYFHESFLSFVNHKWKSFGWKLFMVPFLFYVTFLLFLTTAFALGATKGNPSDYSQPLDGFRLFCEIVVLSMTVIDIILEIQDFWANYNKELKLYFNDWTNWFDILAVLTTLLIVPFRIANLEVQWVFVSLAYIFHYLRIFEYAVMKSFVAIYVEILVRIIIQDIVQFLIVFIVIAISFGGGLYFSLRAQPCPLSQNMTTGTGFSPVTNTSLCLHPDETSEIYLSWLTGLRLLIEGNVINPYIFGNRGFWWFSVMIYGIFLFVVAVVMLNLLIAQFTESYEEVTERARVSVTQNRAKILMTLRSSIWLKLVIPFYRLIQFCKKEKDTVNDVHDFLFFKYRESSPHKASSHDNEYGKIYKQLQASTIADQKHFNVVKELRTQLKDFKVDLESKSESMKSDFKADLECSNESMKKQLDYAKTDLYHKITSELRILKSQATFSEMLMKTQSKSLTAEVETLAESQQSIIDHVETQSRVVKELVTALREQTEMVREQQRQIMESWKSIGEMKDILLQLLQK